MPSSERAQAVLLFAGTLLIVSGIFMSMFGLLVVDGHVLTIDEVLPISGAFAAVGATINLLVLAWRWLSRTRSGS